MKEKVCVAMSGGVDSSVAAALLIERGYEVIGAFMKNWSLEQAGINYKPWENEAHDAEAVCKKLGIAFHVFDFEQEYQKRVVKTFVSEYKRGRTPNPDVLCNREVKFDLFLQKARTLGAEKIATGHYAQVIRQQNNYELHAGIDPEKDQSYFLYTLTQYELPYILFPIGQLLKSQVRELAKKYDLPNAQKKDSQGICFIGPVSMRKFLQNYIPANPGNVVNHEGRVIGKHDGVFYYTEGQRHGFDTGGSHEPLYVAEKRLETNELVVVPSNHVSLYTKNIKVENVTWTTDALPLPHNCGVRVRYRQRLHNASIGEGADALSVVFDTPIESVSIGQSAVFYDHGQVLGGGVIAEKLG